MVVWHHLLNGRAFEQTPGGSEGQGSLVCYSPWGRREADLTERLNNNTIISYSKGDVHLIAGKLSALDNQNSCLIKQKGYFAINNWNDQTNMYQLSIN